VNKYTAVSRIDIYGRENLNWFVQNMGSFSRLPRKRRYLNRDYLPHTKDEMMRFLSNDLAQTKIKVTPEIEQSIWKLREDGLSSRKIAKGYGITKTIVRRHLKQPFFVQPD
jgi:DNA-binding NarL/FixJ family response regulator